MFMQSSSSMFKPAFAMLRIAALNALVMAAPILAIAGDSVHDHSPSTLVQIVRANTAQFINVNTCKVPDMLHYLGASVVLTTAPWEFTT